jgi:tetratricopeptide (TPR) repeat protein
MLFILLLDYKEGKEKHLHISSVPMGLGAAVLSVLFLYIGISQMFVYFKKYDVAAKLFPWDTFAQVKILETADVSDETENLADRITAQNEYIATAYNKKAQIAYSKGDFEKVIEYKNKAMSVTCFSYETQEEYCYMLINGIYLYSKNNDTKSAKICYDELIKTVKYVQNSDDRLSKLGKMIDDQPVKSLPEDITEYVRRVSDDVS